MDRGLHIYQEQGQYLLLSANLDEVAEYLYDHSPFSHGNYSRLEDDLLKNFQEFNNRLIRRDILDEEFDQECLRIILQYQFIPGLLGVDVTSERDIFIEYMRKEYNIKDPLAIHFQEDVRERFPVEQIVQIITDGDIFRHNIPHGIRGRIHRQARVELSKLEHGYSLEQHLVTLGYCFVLGPAFGWKADEFKEQFHKSTRGRPEYVITLPWEVYASESEEDT